MFLDNVGIGSEKKCPIEFIQHPLEVRRIIKNFSLKPMGKYYAIKRGYDFELEVYIRNWIAYSWEECRFYTDGVKDNDFKSFTDYSKAEEYLGRNL